MLPESTYCLTFMNATRPITIVTRRGVEDDDDDGLVDAVPDVEPYTWTTKYLFWTVQRPPTTTYSNASDIVDALSKRRIVYVNEPGYALLQAVRDAWDRRTLTTTTSLTSPSAAT